MKMTKVALVLAFLVVMAAGAVVGMAVDRSIPQQTQVTKPIHPRPPGPHFPQVSKEQSEEIRKIWSGVDALRQERFNTRHTIEAKRLEDIQNLLATAPELKAKYDQIQSNYRADVQKVEDDFQKAVHKAEQDTLALMTPEQQKEYTDFMKQRGPRRGGPGRGGPGRGMRDRRPTTNPATTLPGNVTLAQ